MKKGTFRKGFTLIETLIVVAVIAILVKGAMIGVDEFISTAKATNIINNLITLRDAVGHWYADHKNNVVFYNHEDNGKERLAGTLYFPELTRDSAPVQQWTNSALHITDYLGNGDNFTFNANFNNNHYSQGNNTKLQTGCYGIYDAGEPHTTWYVGYHFKESEEGAVKQKVMARSKMFGLVFTDEGDPFDIIKIERDNRGKTTDLRENGCHNVWMLALKMK